MKSKTSFFSWSLFKRDLFRYWPLWVFSFIALQFMSTIQVYSNYIQYSQSKEGASHTLMTYALMSFPTGAMEVALIGVICVISAVCVFSYLNHRRTTYMIHSLPLTRTTLFVTHFSAGFVMAAVPFLATYGILFIENAIFHVYLGEMLIQYMLQCLVMMIFFYALACLVVMVSGHFMMTVAIYVVVNYLVAGVIQFFDLARNYLSFGDGNTMLLNAGTFNIKWVLTPMVEFLRLNYVTNYNVRWSDVLVSQMSLNSVENYYDYQSGLMTANWATFGKMSLYLIPAAGFIVLALFLYRRRPLEQAGSNLAFPWCRAVFKTVLCFCGSLILLVVIGMAGQAGLFSKLTYGQTRWVSILLLCVCSVICYLVGDMIVNKTFRIWKHISWLQMIIITAALGVLYVAQGAYFIRESLPDVSEITSASVSISYNAFRYYDADVIQKLLDVHEKMIDESSSHELGESTDSYINIIYRTKDGRSIGRVYYVNSETYSDVMDLFADLIQSNTTGLETFADMTDGVYDLKCTDLMIDYYNGSVETGELIDSVILSYDEYLTELESYSESTRAKKDIDAFTRANTKVNSAIEAVAEALQQDMADGNVIYRLSWDGRESEDYQITDPVYSMSATFTYTNNEGNHSYVSVYAFLTEDSVRTLEVLYDHGLGDPYNLDPEYETNYASSLTLSDTDEAEVNMEGEDSAGDETESGI